MWELHALVKNILMNRFEMRDMGRVRHFLGVEFLQRDNGMMMTQRKYTRQILERFSMQDCRSISTPMATSIKVKNQQGDGDIRLSAERFKEVIGSLLYLSTRTRPDIVTAVGILSRDSGNPTKESWVGVKRILRYLQGTDNLGLFFKYAGWNGSRMFKGVL